MTTLKAHFDGQVLVPEQPVELPTNCTLEVTVRQLGAQQKTLELLEQWEREDAALSSEQQAQNERVFAEIERNGIPRVRL